MPFARTTALPRALLLTALVIVLALIALNTPVYAAALPSGFTESLVATGLTKPTAFEIAPDGRIFVTQQEGALRVIDNGTLLATAFLTVTTDFNGERGLLGIAFDPDYLTNRFVYIYYTVPGSPPHNRVSRFTANAAGTQALGGTELPILDLENLTTAQNHNGGAIHFGPDGKLYVAVGENANHLNSQTLNNRLGKMLRINSDGSIPDDNPFNATATGLNQSIWAMGLRNPFTFGFQPGTGRLHINDVGEGTWEEINLGVAGSNYGWKPCEGFCNPPNPTYRDPILAYPHNGGAFNGCSIVGGTFYNPTTNVFPADYNGDYFFADLCRGWIRRYDIGTSTSTEFATGLSTPVDLHVHPDGSLYYLARGGTGQLWRVIYDPGAPTNTPTNTRTNTPVPNTSTPTRTNTPVANTSTPTRTNTTAPNTSTPTRTNTTVPNTATRTRTPTRTRTATPTQFMPPTPTAIGGTWTFCANQNRTCNVPGTRLVRFGANGKYKYKTVTNSIPCTAAVFGGDPIQGVAKKCEYAGPNQATPTNTPTKTPKPKAKGLRGVYYSDTELTTIATERIDSRINFNFDTAAPDEAVTTDTYSIRWDSTLRTKQANDYTFTLETDGGVRLYIDNNLLIDAWDAPQASHQATYHLDAKTKYNIRLEYRHTQGQAHIRLYWQSPNLERTLIPKRAFSIPLN